MGFTTVLSMHMEKPATNAPSRYTSNLSTTPDRYWMPTPMKPMATAAKAVFL